MNAGTLLHRGLGEWGAAMMLLFGGAIACTSNDSKGARSASPSAMADGSANKDDPKRGAPPKRGVDVKTLLGSSDKDGEANALPVNLDGIKDDAPTIATKLPTGADITWIDAGSDSIPNFGFKKEQAKDLLYLAAPDKSGGVVFTTFSDQAEGEKRVADIVAQLKLKDTKWRKAKPVLLPADKIPALIGVGRGTDPEGKGVKVVYAFIKGEPNLLAIAGVNDSAPESVEDEVFATIGGIKRRAK